MSVAVNYKTLVTELDRVGTISFGIPATESPEKVKRKLSMAKHREGIEGKLLFSYEPTIIQGQDAFLMTVVLTPKANTVQVLSTSKEGF